MNILERDAAAEHLRETGITLTADIGGRRWHVDTNGAFDISIPLRFDGTNPAAFGVTPARATALQAGSTIFDVREGGSCNVDEVTLIPHCTGTHTECIGHLTAERPSIRGTLRHALLPCTVVSLRPVDALGTSESYLLPKESGDLVLTADALHAALRDADPSFLRALVIRTEPNDESKCSRDYSRLPAPFFTIEAMHAIVGMGVDHLLVDFPSLDRADDEGLLSAHRVFWNLEAGSVTAGPEARRHRTVTEMVYVPTDVRDGRYLVNIQIAPFVADAAPSRPVLLPVTLIESFA